MTAGLLQAGTGCIISGDDDDDDVVVDDGDDLGDDLGDDVGDDGTGEGILYQVNWLCPPAAIDITFTATPFGSSTSLQTDTFPCEDGDIGADIFYDPGSYDIDIIPVGDIGTFAGLTDTVEGADGDLIQATYDSFPEDEGYFFLTWTIDNDDPALVCPEILTGGVGVLSTLVSPDDSFDDLFDCEAGEGITSELPIGDYTVEISLLDDLEPPGALDSILVEDVGIDFGDQLNDLGDFNLVSTPK